MIKIYSKIFCIFYLIFGIAEIKAQGVVAVTGGIATGNNGSFTYMVGQSGYMFTNGNDGALSPWLSQSIAISTVLSDPEIYDLTEIIVYPNPTANIVNIELDKKGEEFSYQLYQMNGKLLEHKRMNGELNSIDLTKYNTKSFILNVLFKESIFRTIKIVKQ